MRYILIAVMCSGMATGCSTITGQSLFTDSDEGRLLLDTDRAGLEAWFQGLNGLVTTGKSAPNIKDAYWDTQETNIKTRTFAVVKGGKTYDVGGNSK